MLVVKRCYQLTLIGEKQLTSLLTLENPAQRERPYTHLLVSSLNSGVVHVVWPWSKTYEVGSFLQGRPQTIKKSSFSSASLIQPPNQPSPHWQFSSRTIPPQTWPLSSWPLKRGKKVTGSINRWVTVPWLRPPRAPVLDYRIQEDPLLWLDAMNNEWRDLGNRGGGGEGAPGKLRGRFTQSTLDPESAWERFRSKTSWNISCYPNRPKASEHNTNLQLFLQRR